ncbi:MAG: Asp23/Gls24 family envelope stress response protein [Candidatus Bipolaricaulia bacterium]
MAEKGGEKRRRASRPLGDLGQLTISDEVFAAIAERAVAEVRAGPPGPAALLIGGRGKGVETKLEDDETVRFSLRVSLRYGEPIPLLSQELQEQITKRVREMTGLRVSAVDIYIQEIRLPPAEGWSEPVVEAEAD